MAKTASCDFADKILTTDMITLGIVRFGIDSINSKELLCTCVLFKLSFHFSLSVSCSLVPNDLSASEFSADSVQSAVCS